MSPFASAAVAARLARETGLPWIADLRDPWTDIYYYNDMLHTRAAAAKDKAFEKAVVEQADELLVVSRPILENYLSKSDAISASKIHVIPNGYDEDDFGPVSDTVNSIFTITYTGTIADSYNPAVFFESLRLAREAMSSLKIRLLFVGAGTENLQTLIRVHGLENITAFIHNALINNKHILIHCKNGHHRSAVVVGAYLIKYLNYDYLGTIKYIKKLRPYVFKDKKCISEWLFRYYLYLHNIKCSTIHCYFENELNICECVNK
jgi:hypothetical protein